MRQILVFVASLALGSSTATAAIWHVPADVPTIQGAIDLAAVGDVIVVAAGTYTEVVFISKDVRVISESGPGVTTIMGNGAESVVTFAETTSRAALLEGFTVTGGAGTGVDAGGIRAAFCSPTVRGNLVTDNYGSGISARGAGEPLFSENVVTGNGVGIMHWASNATITGNRIVNNGDHGIELANAPPAEISFNVITGNAGDGIHGVIPEGSPNVLILSNIIVANATGVVLTYFANSVLFDRNIVAFNVGPGISCGDPYGLCPLIACTDLYGNGGGDWVGGVASQAELRGNFSADPRFCDAANGDYTLDGSSPCLPGNHPDGIDCGLIGALGQGCGPTAVEKTTWGRLKMLYRSP